MMKFSKKYPLVTRLFELIKERTGLMTSDFGERVLINQSLEGKNPWDRNLSEGDQYDVIKECQENPSYFLDLLKSTDWATNYINKDSSVDLFAVAQHMFYSEVEQDKLVILLHMTLSEMYIGDTALDRWDDNLSEVDVVAILEEVIQFAEQLSVSTVAPPLMLKMAKDIQVMASKLLDKHREDKKKQGDPTHPVSQPCLDVCNEAPPF